MSLRISKTPQAFRWYLEDMDAAGSITESADFATWQEAEAAARAAHPELERVWLHLVRGYGVAYPDSL